MTVNGTAIISNDEDKTCKRITKEKAIFVYLIVSSSKIQIMLKICSANFLLMTSVFLVGFIGSAWVSLAHKATELRLGFRLSKMYFF